MRTLLVIAAVLVATTGCASPPKTVVYHHCTCSKPCPDHSEYDRFVIVRMPTK